MQRRQTIALSIVATSFAPQGFTKAATPPSNSFGDVEDAQAFGLNEWIRGLRLDGDHASPSIARPATKLGRTRQPGPLATSEAAWASSPTGSLHPMRAKITVPVLRTSSPKVVRDLRPSESSHATVGLPSPH